MSDMSDVYETVCWNAIYIGGPGKSAAIVYNKEDIEPIIKTLAELHGFDEDDNTATDIHNCTGDKWLT